MAILFTIGVASAGWVQHGTSDTNTVRAAAVIGTVGPGSGNANSAEVQETEYGPLTAADKDLLIKVRLAGLWEGPAGVRAVQRSRNPLVKEAGRHLIDGHSDLDAKVLALGQQFGVELPREPSSLQQSMLNDMDEAKTPEDFDRVFAQHIRAAHGKVYAFLAQMRAGTQNSMIRAFAEYCMKTVLDHITVSEKTGLVDWNKIEQPPTPDGLTGVSTGIEQTKYGPLSAADRDFLVKVRLAGLWEKPSGTAAQVRSQSPLVKEAGQHLIDGHADLDAKVLAIGKLFNVPLPTEPNADQKAWMQEMNSAQSSRQFDRVFANRLRVAHGKVYSLLSKMRTGSQNVMIRTFAQYSMNTVLDHMTVLEKTKMVDWNQVPQPPAPEVPKPLDRNVNWIVVFAMLAAGLVVSGVVLRELYSRR